MTDVDHWKSAVVRHCPKGNCDVEISYECIGNPLNPTVLLVMGLNGQGLVWDDSLCEMIAAAGFHVIRFDNRDVGKSTKFGHMPCPSIVRLILPRPFWGAAPYELSDMAADAAALLDHLGIEKAIWVGVSMGGMICQVAAIEFPHKVSAVASVMSSTMNPTLPDPPLWVQLDFLKKPKSNAPEDLIDFRVAFAQRILYYQVPDVDVERIRRRTAIQVARSTYAAGVVRQLYAVRSSYCRDERLQGVRMPFTVIHGTLDLLVPPSHGYHTANMVPNSRLVIVPDMGHSLLPRHFRLLTDELIALQQKARGL
jgi:pimeloyl-ACP methyl ester carboxylesterase